MKKHKKTEKSKPSSHFETLSIHSGTGSESTHGARNMPIFQTVCYHFKDAKHGGNLFGLEEEGFIYARLNNPTVEALENRVATLEGGVAACAASSGLSAEFLTLFALMKAGDEFISSHKIYGGSSSAFFNSYKKLGWTVKFADPLDIESFAKAITPRTRAIFVESCSNPAGVVPDFGALAKICRQAEIPLIIDNTMPTAALFQPLQHGANIVILSLTKYMSGHSTSMGGAVVDGGNFNWLESGKYESLTKPDESYHGITFAEKFGNKALAVHLHAIGLRDFGPCLSPMNAFQILTGIETLSLRMQKHVENADAVAQFLEHHPQVSWVSYPRLASSPSYKNAKLYMPRGCGSVFTFGLKKSRAGFRVPEFCKIFRNMAHVGDSGSLIIHPASTTHRQLTEDHKKKANATADVIRLSVGLENTQDLLEDLDQAITRAVKS